MTTASEDRSFLNDVIGTGLLETSIEWISDNLDPEDVFNESALEDWAIRNNYQKIPDSE